MVKLRLFSLFVFSFFSSRHEQAILSGRPAGVVVPPACAAGHHSEEEECALLGRSGTAHLATVPQDGWEGIIWYVERVFFALISLFSNKFRDLFEWLLKER